MKIIFKKHILYHSMSIGLMKLDLLILNIIVILKNTMKIVNALSLFVERGKS